MSTKIQQHFIELLEEAVRDKIENFEVTIPNEKITKDGSLSEMIFVSLKHKKSGENYDFVVKQVPPSTTEVTAKFMSATYCNEIRFYTQVWPALDNFQKSFPEGEIFQPVPNCYASSLLIGEEKIALENLKIKMYELHPKKEPLDFELYEGIFKVYGKLHGLIFAFKEQNPETFLKWGTSLENNWKKFVDTGVIGRGLTAFFKMSKQIVEMEGEEQILEKLLKYVDNTTAMFSKSTLYTGPHSIIVHGDCWSNNLMIKYNELREVEDIKLVDFQMCYLGTPVFDLTYSLYSGANKPTLDNLELLLQIYHKQLGATLRQYKCDPEQIYPYTTLKKEWKEWNTFGFMMGVLLWVSKQMEVNNDGYGMNKIMDNINQGREQQKSSSPVFDKVKIRELLLDLFRHMDENDFL